eukprot:TRINITY_DN2662_c0_g1_i3.p1 TRINITY_DN2662_c0_g1~~TRINITY_DN2662_c0_g1_i3.p1  ORF type:complete len:262 (+),score=38.53 TRINITY_DN2662_c0_g1_i3:71-787(+)
MDFIGKAKTMPKDRSLKIENAEDDLSSITHSDTDTAGMFITTRFKTLQYRQEAESLPIHLMQTNCVCFPAGEGELASDHVLEVDVVYRLTGALHIADLLPPMHRIVETCNLGPNALDTLLPAGTIVFEEGTTSYPNRWQNKPEKYKQACRIGTLYNSEGHPFPWKFEAANMIVLFLFNGLNPETYKLCNTFTRHVAHDDWEQKHKQKLIREFLAKLSKAGILTGTMVDEAEMVLQTST